MFKGKINDFNGKKNKISKRKKKYKQVLNNSMQAYYERTISKHGSKMLKKKTCNTHPQCYMIETDIL